MLNAYPDSLGGKLSDIVSLLSTDEMMGAFGSFYILPSLFDSDLDRGFSVKSYDLNGTLADKKDLEDLKALGIDLKLDLVLNHASVQSGQFKDLIEKGESSVYRDFFINWNRFWAGHGTMGDDGAIIPDETMISGMFFRKPGLPYLMVEFGDGTKAPYWNTFYQKVWKEDGETRYLGQMDLNVKSPLVWDFYRESLEKLADHGARIVRLDAFAYASKEPGRHNFLNEPETWDILERINGIGKKLGLTLLPEIHAAYSEGIYEEIASGGYLTYDFFLPGLVIDALESHDATKLAQWAEEIKDKGLRVVNMLGCHDGIPLLDLKGMLSGERIAELIDTVVSRGGLVKNLHGKKNIYYQVNATYFSALGEDERKLLLARAIQLFMPGKPEIWYLDLFAGANDAAAVEAAGPDGHKEINRTNLTAAQIEEGLKKDVVKTQLEMLKFRTAFPAFSFDSLESATAKGSKLTLTHSKEGFTAELTCDLKDTSFEMKGTNPEGRTVFSLSR